MVFLAPIPENVILDARVPHRVSSHPKYIIEERRQKIF